MSQVSQPGMSFPVAVRPRRAVWLTALVALAAAAAVVLILALDGGSSSESASVSAKDQPVLRADQGPEETSVAAAVGSPAAAGPDESRIAASVGSGSPTSSPTGSGPDESRTAASVSGR